MKVLLIGSGGREHAMAFALQKSPLVDKIYCAPGNGGMEKENKCENLNIKDYNELLNFSIDNEIDLTVVGPEVPLCDGIVDLFRSKGLKIFGPDKKAAMLEGSKIFSKNFMKKYGVKTAEYGEFHDKGEALKYLENCSYPIVIKADGLAAGKGVVIAKDYKEASLAVEDFMDKAIFGDSGKSVVIEEFLEGKEVSVLSITDGNIIVPFVSAKDHKTIYEHDEGPNTGGMGTIAPNPYYTKEAEEDFIKAIMNPTLKGIQGEKMDYKGFIFFGLMITKKGAYLLEYNVRLGDPETQVVLPLMESDFAKVILNALNGTLSKEDVVFKKAAACCVIGVSKGYPLKYETHKKITGIENIKEGHKLLISGAKYEDGELYTSGGRVLGVTAIADTLEQAVEESYEEIVNIDFEGKFFRKDIGE